MKKLILAAALIAFTAQPALADKYVFDKLHTQIMFSVEHMGYSFSHGRFAEFDGHFIFDEDKPEKSSTEVTIKTASIDMGDQKWDDHLKNADFFNVEKFPEMTFKSTKVEKTGDKTGKLTGDLTILGVTKPVTLDVTFNKAAVHPFLKKDAAGFSATGTIKRSEFGMTYGLPGVGDDVALNIQVEGYVDDGKPAEEVKKEEPKKAEEKKEEKKAE